MSRLPAKINRYFRQIKGYNSRTQKIVTFEMELGLPFIVSDFVYEFQMIPIIRT